jgi:hypothetical protein
MDLVPEVKIIVHREGEVLDEGIVEAPAAGVESPAEEPVETAAA